MGPSHAPSAAAAGDIRPDRQQALQLAGRPAGTRGNAVNLKWLTGCGVAEPVNDRLERDGVSGGCVRDAFAGVASVGTQEKLLKGCSYGLVN